MVCKELEMKPGYSVMRLLSIKMNLDVLASPLERISNQLFTKKRVNIFIKRDDLIHPVIEGNKFRKLKYNIEKIIKGQYKVIETFGGAYSNHLLAVSQAGKYINIPTIGYVNAAYADPNNHTLKACAENGMELRLIDKVNFKKLLEEGRGIDNNSYFLPEGGSNEEALKGTSEIVTEILVQLPSASHIVCPLGTGGTIAGMTTTDNKHLKIIAVPVLKMDAVSHLQNKFNQLDFDDLEIWPDCHFGGYAKIQPELIDFIKTWYDDTNIVIDPIYNGKALYGLFDKINNDHFPEGSNIIYVHTGGSQGIYGMNERFGLKLPVK